jgi:retron-type reverse transcriptase
MGTFLWIVAGLAVVLFVVLAARVARARRPWSDPRPGEAQRAFDGKGLGVEELARRLGIGPRELERFTPSYREARIPKRSGGTRRLLVPDDRTKALQRRILRRLLARLRAHPAANGFERGRSIVSNALPHVGRAVVVKLDVVDFFPATAAHRLDGYFRRIGWDADAAELLVKLTTHEGGLPQGAPTSPRLSNLVNFHMDGQLARLAARRKGSYTRYADDLTFSFPKDYPRRVRGVVQRARRILAANGYLMHGRRKLSIRRAHQRQAVTGLVVNAKASLPRERRRWLRAVRHRMTKGKAATITPAQLQGWDAFERMVRTQRAAE